VSGAPVGQIIAIDRCDNRVGQIQMTNSFRDMERLFGVKLTRLAFPNGAKATMARANIACQHECCRAIRPTLEDVWAASLLTDCVEVQPLDQVKNVVLICGIADTDL
jgi:hypothetical protein